MKVIQQDNNDGNYGQLSNSTRKDPLTLFWTAQK